VAFSPLNQEFSRHILILLRFFRSMSSVAYRMAVFQLLLDCAKSRALLILHIILTLKIYVMTTFEKHYIGKGTQVPNLSIVKVVIPVENIQDAIFEKDGKEYLSFEIAKLKNPDKFGRDYTCYYQQKVYSEDAPSNEPEKQKKAQKPAGKKKTAKKDSDDLPF
jgi:hypothetical protein